MKTYTVGFIFNEDLSQVLLMLKKRPDWQVGKLNGIGGKIEAGESSLQCMVRETQEETGLKTEERDWGYVARIKGEDWWVDFYAYSHKGSTEEISATTDEPVSWFEIHALPKHVLSNLRWLVPLSVDKLRNDDFKACLIEHNGGERR